MAKKYKGGKKIGHGEYGNVYSPVLKTVNHSESEFLGADYVGKVLNEKDAKLEWANSMKIRELDPVGMWSVTAEKMSPILEKQNNSDFAKSETNRKTRKNKFIKNISDPDPELLFYPSTTQLIYKNGGKSLATMLTKSGVDIFDVTDVNDVYIDRLPDFIKATKLIIPGVDILNTKYIHQDLHPGNILWDGTRARLIDFSEMETIEERFIAKKKNFIGNLEKLGLKPRSGNSGLQLYDVMMDRIDRFMLEDATKYDVERLHQNLQILLSMDWVKEIFPGKYDNWLKKEPFSRCDYIQTILSTPE